MLALTPEELTAIKLSLKVAAAATLVSLPFGIAVAMLIGRCRFLGRPLLNALVLLPLVLPPVVTGYVLLLLFGRKGPIGAWLAGYAYDQLGTYAPAFLFGVVLNIANIVIIWCLAALGLEKKSSHTRAISVG